MCPARWPAAEPFAPALQGPSTLSVTSHDTSSSWAPEPGCLPACFCFRAPSNANRSPAQLCLLLITKPTKQAPHAAMCAHTWLPLTGNESLSRVQGQALLTAGGQSTEQSQGELGGQRILNRECDALPRNRGPPARCPWAQLILTQV